MAPVLNEHAWLREDGLTIGGALVTFDPLKDLSPVPLVAAKVSHCRRPDFHSRQRSWP